MLHCTVYKEQRSQSIQLQQPYLESDQNTVGQFLFDKENIEKKKEFIRDTFSWHSLYSNKMYILYNIHLNIKVIV